MKRSKLLHLGGTQLQKVVYNIPEALSVVAGDTNPYELLVDKLNQHFSPKKNFIFESYLFRSIKPEEGETFNKFILRLRNQAEKSQFVQTAKVQLKMPKAINAHYRVISH